MYTLLGSIFVLFAFLSIYFSIGTSTFDTLAYANFTSTKQIAFFVLFVVGFAVKIPIMPVHIWLPEAHMLKHLHQVLLF